MAQQVILQCPLCGNTDPDLLSTRKKPARAAYIFLVIGFPFLFKQKNVHCFNCNHDFPPPEGYKEPVED